MRTDGLPRQAQDKRRESTQKRVLRFRLYDSIFAQKQSQERERLDRMQGGLGKLTEVRQNASVESFV